MKFYINTDGGSRGNPGPSGIGVVIRLHAHTYQPRDVISTFIGTATNNVAEYRALLAALDWLRPNVHDDDEVYIYSDSELMVNQMLGTYQCKSPSLIPLYLEAQEKLGWLGGAYVEFHHILREFNKDADALANEAMDKYGKSGISGSNAVTTDSSL